MNSDLVSLLAVQLLPAESLQREFPLPLASSYPLLASAYQAGLEELQKLHPPSAADISCSPRSAPPNP